MENNKNIYASIIKQNFIAIYEFDMLKKQANIISNAFSCKNEKTFFHSFSKTFIHEEDQDYVNQKLQFMQNTNTTMVDREDIYYEFRGRLHEDEMNYRWMEAHHSYADHQVIITIRDISYQKELMEHQMRMESYRLIALKNSFLEMYEIDLVENRYQSLFDHFMNAWKEGFGHADAQSLLWMDQKYIHQDDRQAWKKATTIKQIKKQFDQGAPYISIDYRKMILDEVYWMNATFLPIVSESNQQLAILMIRDITQQYIAQELKLNNDNLQRQIHTQITHYQHMEEVEHELRNFRHDMKNHLLVLESLQEEQNIEEFKRYIASLRGYLKADDTMIKTGNAILDALLSEKFAYLKTLGIRLQKELNIESAIHMDPTDICILFGNAFDNAIEAVLKLAEDTRWMKCQFVYRKHVLVLRLSNPCDPILAKTKQPFKTSKQDKHLHGLGIQNMKRVTEKYDGLFSLELADETVSLTITLSL